MAAFIHRDTLTVARVKSWTVGTAMTLTATTALATAAKAQIVPDNTLGDENSAVTPAALVQGDLADLIEGGAIRGNNLFHSFLQFNVNDGQRVYFANPTGIESILTRITGGDPSNILGTLGVNGTADLFLINPNGIVFGENAVLDLQGSFYASTAEAIPLEGGLYSATDPQQSSLLTVNPSAFFSHYLSDTSGNIANRGHLAAPENLTLAANQLDLRGQVAAGGNLTLLGTDTVQIRDTAAVPFVGFAGGNLLVQGNEQVDIVALSHPDSGLSAYGDMVLRSANPVGGDAQYWSAGNFRVETLEGTPGDLFSPVDPIIRTYGNVVIESYLGSSLHILAGGSVEIGTAEITAPDPGKAGIDFLQETIQLTDGTVIEVNGAAQPTLDVRAGVSPEVLGAPPVPILTGFDPSIDVFRSDSFVTGFPTSANITVGDVRIQAPDSLVLLTNQYAPNTALANGNIFITGQGAFGSGIDVQGAGGQGGSVYLDARDSVAVFNSAINTTGAGQVGDVVINAGETVRFDRQDRLTGVVTSLAADTTGKGGDIRITATDVELLDGAQLQAITQGNGNAGSVVIKAYNSVLFTDTSADGQVPSAAFSGVEAGATGRAGSVRISAETVEVRQGAGLTASTRSEGNAGNVVIRARDRVVFDGTSADGKFVSGAFTRLEQGGTGRGGNVAIATGSLEVTRGATLTASNLGRGQAGNVVIDAVGSVVFDGTTANGQFASGAFSRLANGAIGSGGDVIITAGTLDVTNGAELRASTSGKGNAGNVVLDVDGLARFDGGTADSSIQANGEGNGGNVYIKATTLDVTNGSQLAVRNLGKGNAGNVLVVGNTLAVTNQSQISASTLGKGNAGNVFLDIDGLARFDRESSTNSSVQPNGDGQGGIVYVEAGTLEVTNGAQLFASTFGIGSAGDVILNIVGTARFDGVSPVAGRSSSGANSTVETGGIGDGGDVKLTAANLEVTNGAQLSTATFWAGSAGDVILNIAGTARFDGVNPFIENAVSTANTGVQSGGQGEGGDVILTATTLAVTNRASLSAASFESSNAGNIKLDISKQMLVDNATIRTNALQASGGTIDIQAGNLILRNDGDIRTDVARGEGTGGDITIAADFVIAFDDSDILAFSADGRGGAIDLSQTTFFGENPNFASENLSREELLALDGNDQVDVNASGDIAPGQISLNDSSFIENSLITLEETVVDTATLTAGSCIARTDDRGSFIVTGRDGLPYRPGDMPISSYPTGTVQAVPEATTIQEPDGAYRLADGRLVLSRTCDEN